MELIRESNLLIKYIYCLILAVFAKKKWIAGENMLKFAVLIMVQFREKVTSTASETRISRAGTRVLK